MEAINLYNPNSDLTPYQFSQLLLQAERERKIEELSTNNELLQTAKRMLKTWGAVNSYSSGCGYKSISAMFNQLFPKSPLTFIENEIEFIENCLLMLKNSKNEKEKLQFDIAERCYKGFDVVINGTDGSERLSYEVIAQDLDISRRTLFNRLNELHSFIVAQLSRFDFF